MYHGDLVAAVIAARLEDSGVALISLAIRRQASPAALRELVCVAKMKDRTEIAKYAQPFYACLEVAAE